MATSIINPTQKHLIKLFAFNKSQKSLSELKDVLFNYYACKTDRLLDEFWNDNKMTETKLAETANKHIRTPYK